MEYLDAIDNEVLQRARERLSGWKAPEDRFPSMVAEGKPEKPKAPKPSAETVYRSHGPRGPYKSKSECSHIGVIEGNPLWRKAGFDASGRQRYECPRCGTCKTMEAVGQ